MRFSAISGKVNEGHKKKIGPIFERVNEGDKKK